MTAVSGSWWSGPYDHRGIAVADSRDGSPNGYHVLSIDGQSYSTQFQPANEPNSRQMRIVLDSDFHRDRKELYSENGSDYRDNHKRFALLCAGALEAARQQNFQPDAVHAHDWQCALVPLIMKRGFGGRPSPVRARSGQSGRMLRIPQSRSNSSSGIRAAAWASRKRR